MENKNKQNERPFHEDVTHSRVAMQDEISGRVTRIEKEFKEAFEFIKCYPRSVSFFGSSRSRENDPYYEKARALAGRIAKDLQYTILTGGGKGIMEGANRGAFEAGGESVGLNITLPTEQLPNEYTSDQMNFYYFFTRKVALSFAAEAYIFFPGGFGTLDEFFEIATLVQTRKIPSVPIILYGREFWENLSHFIEENLLKKHGAIDEEDMSLYTITENEEEIIEIIKNAPLQHG
ncbi:MAG: TIGR00730 family Rossman fold protein [bacterium]|nr:TIGR00730 family Rossman fold protein [bacterium]